MTMTDFQKLTCFNNLYRSFLVSSKGRGSRRGAMRFNANALENLYVMKERLLDHSYKIGAYYEFEVSEPKKRTIKAGTFQDKVLQHCLCDYVLLPRMQTVFLKDNYAGQTGKGTLFGLNRLSENMSSFYRQFGLNGYILKCDIRKFFYSIEHEKMKQCIRHYIPDEDVCWVCDLFIDSAGSDCGLPLGNQCSQVFALMFLDGMDHFIVEQLGCRFYGRYMDDFYLISQDKAYLQSCLAQIASWLDALHLQLNEKTEIVPLSKGIRFLGFHSYLTADGKVIRKLTGSNKRQARKRIRKMVRLVSEGRLSQEKFRERYNSWCNHISHGNCYKLTQSMDQFVEQLFDAYHIRKGEQTE